MSEFLNYVPVEGSVGELLFDFLRVVFVCGCLWFAVYVFSWLVSTIKKIAERE